ncbi:hypothetical protein KC345_g52 [Hortaea werneckii]|nr:hypothetical protein KC345_g52 [Hortaea werneckii]
MLQNLQCLVSRRRQISIDLAVPGQLLSTNTAGKPMTTQVPRSIVMRTMPAPGVVASEGVAAWQGVAASQRVGAWGRLGASERGVGASDRLDASERGATWREVAASIASAVAPVDAGKNSAIHKLSTELLSRDIIVFPLPSMWLQAALDTAAVHDHNGVSMARDVVSDQRRVGEGRRAVDTMSAMSEHNGVPIARDVVSDQGRLSNNGGERGAIYIRAFVYACTSRTKRAFACESVTIVRVQK